jgi:hypothetical protein
VNCDDSAQQHSQSDNDCGFRIQRPNVFEIWAEISAQVWTQDCSHAVCRLLRDDADRLHLWQRNRANELLLSLVSFPFWHVIQKVLIMESPILTIICKWIMIRVWSKRFYLNYDDNSLNRWCVFVKHIIMRALIGCKVNVTRSRQHDVGAFIVQIR